MDITNIPMARGFVYLAVVLDWFSRRVLAWRLSITMEAAFCVEALEDAMARHGKPEILNTDSQRIGVSSRWCCPQAVYSVVRRQMIQSSSCCSGMRSTLRTFQRAVSVFSRRGNATSGSSARP
jgi:transposase InsO family protein